MSPSIGISSHAVILCQSMLALKITDLIVIIDLIKIIELSIVLNK
ncbi:hypothetical protein VRK_05480 [Vibrio sp. MEBiC08052]|nr:hypothetical protein VRK_05480 [Vibrio sp. MEBiC08052]